MLMLKLTKMNCFREKEDICGEEIWETSGN